MGKPCAKLVVPSSGSTYQRNSESDFDSPPSSATMAVGGEPFTNPSHDQFLGLTVSARNQVEGALVVNLARLIVEPGNDIPCVADRPFGH